MKKYLAILLVVLLCFISVEVLAKSKKAGKKMNYTYGTKTFNTPEAYSLPSSYFLDLRGIYKTTTTQQYTADVAILHNIQGHTITLNDIDETNNVGTAGPIAGGRDQADAFTVSDWIHFFFIYNPVTGDVSSLSSASPTAPTLPTGYTFFVRVGAVWLNGAGQIVMSYQMGDVVTGNARWVRWDQHVVNTSYLDEIDLSDFVPATAKIVHGFMGLSAGTTARKMYVSAEESPTVRIGALCDAQGTGDPLFGVSGSKDFSLPLVTAQRMWWITETTGDIYALAVTGYTDDL